MRDSKETTYLSLDCGECGTIVVETRRKLSEKEIPIKLAEIRERHIKLHENARRFERLKYELQNVVRLMEER